MPAPSISTEELVLPRHYRCVLSRLRSNVHSLLLNPYHFRLAESRRLSAAPADTRPNSYLFLHCEDTDFCATHALATFCHFTTSGPGPGEFPAFWAPWSCLMLPSLGRGLITKTTRYKILACFRPCNNV